MARQTSTRVASQAARVLGDSSSTKAERSAAGSALTQFKAQQELLKQVRRTRTRVVGWLKTLGWTLAGLVVIQISLGVMTVLSQKAVDITTAHVATGAALLATTVLSSLATARVYGFSRATRPVPIPAGRVAA